MSVSLKDALKLNYGMQGQLQGAGTPNEAGIGGSFRSGWVPGLPKSMNQFVAPTVGTPPSASIPLMS
jgi:hypothetical protein